MGRDRGDGFSDDFQISRPGSDHEAYKALAYQLKLQQHRTTRRYSDSSVWLGPF